MDVAPGPTPGVPTTSAPDTLPHYAHAEILRVVTGMMLCILLGALDQTVVIPAVPAIASDLGAFGHLSWIVTAYLLTSTAATPILGRLSDILGRRALLLPSILLFMAASALCALSGSLVQLILARALQGLGGAGLLSMAQAAIADVVSPRERGRYQGYMASMWGVASIAGPVAGGWVTDAFSWRWVFWVNLPLGCAALWMCDRALRRFPVRRQQARIDYLGAGLLSAGVSALLLTLSWGGVEFPWASLPVLGTAAAGLLLLLLLAWQERRFADPLLPPRLFRNALFVRGVAVGFFSSLALFGATFTLPLLFQLVRGADAAASGLLVMPFLASSVAGAFCAGQLARRLGRTKALVLAGLAACCVGFVLLALVGPGWPDAAIMAATVLLGGGIGTTMPSVLMQVQNAAERRDVGVATGTMLFLRSLGGAFGSTLVGAVLAAHVAARLLEAGITAHVDLGELRGRGSAFSGLDASVQALAREALASGFRLSYLVCAGLVLVAAGVAAGMKDAPLRSSQGG